MRPTRSLLADASSPAPRRVRCCSTRRPRAPRSRPSASATRRRSARGATSRCRLRALPRPPRRGAARRHRPRRGDVLYRAVRLVARRPRRSTSTCRSTTVRPPRREEGPSARRRLADRGGAELRRDQSGTRSAEFDGEHHTLVTSLLDGTLKNTFKLHTHSVLALVALPDNAHSADRGRQDPRSSPSTTRNRHARTLQERVKGCAAWRGLRRRRSTRRRARRAASPATGSRDLPCIAGDLDFGGLNLLGPHLLDRHPRPTRAGGAARAARRDLHRLRRRRRLRPRRRGPVG